MSKLIDLTGQKFGKLIVLSRGESYIAPGTKKITSRWKVKCEECKIEYDLLKIDFLRKKNQTCNQHNHIFRDLTGQKFGKLVIIERGKDYTYSNETKKGIRWKVKCEECEEEYEISETSFLAKKNQNCDQHSHSYINLIGKRFGKLTVIGKDEEYYISPKHKNKYIRWICECDCGNTHSVMVGTLNAKKATQCKECYYKSYSLNGYISNRYIARIKRNAKKRNLYFDKKIDREYLWNLFLKQNKKCALSNLSIHFAKTIKQQDCNRGTTASIDRIDSSIGYELDNIQLTVNPFNHFKNSYTLEEYYRMCTLSHLHLKDKMSHVII